MEEINITNINPVTGEIEGNVVGSGVPVRGRCINTPTDAIILMHPFPNPTTIYVGHTMVGPDSTVRGLGGYRITGAALAADEGTWGGEKPPA